MALDLEIAGIVREVEEGEVAPAAKPRQLMVLRDSHQHAARLVARGLRDEEICHITGYTLSRLSTLKRDPSFQELVARYRFESADVAADLEARYLGIANDFAQHIHEKLLDEPDEVSPAFALEVFKTFADRGGMSPVSRSVNKNLNLNIGERLDAARRRRTIEG